MSFPELEICVYSVESALIAQESGADRVELCSGFLEGGLTPSAGMIQMVRKKLHIQCYVMIRPRGGDFCYSNSEYKHMCADIRFAKKCGADGVALGILKPDGQIDIDRTRKLVELAAPLKVTFHRAIDKAVAPLRAVDDIITCGCHRILTSGHHQTAMEGLKVIGEMVYYANKRINIMAGSGINIDNVYQLIETGVQALHLSAKKMIPSRMHYRNIIIPSMQNLAVPDNHWVDIDAEQIKAMAHAIRHTVG